MAHSMSSKLPGSIIAASPFLALFLSAITIIAGVVRYAFLQFNAPGQWVYVEAIIAIGVGVLLSILIDGAITACCARLMKSLERNKKETIAFMQLGNPSAMDIHVYRAARTNLRVSAWFNLAGIVIFSSFSTLIGQVAWEAVWKSISGNSLEPLALSSVVSIVLIFSELNRSANNAVVLDSLKVPVSFPAQLEAELKVQALKAQNKDRKEIAALGRATYRKDKTIRLERVRELRKKGMPLSEAAKQAGIHIATAYRYEREAGEQGPITAGEQLPPAEKGE